MLWTHHLKNITYDETFLPDGAPDRATYKGIYTIFAFFLCLVCLNSVFKAMTVSAGVQWHEAYDAAESYGRFVVGGLSAGGSVGAAGGWVMGGGHSAFSAKYGLGM